MTREKIHHRETPDPICPHCGEVYADPDYDMLADDGNKDWVNCLGCDGRFQITAHVERSFSTEIIGDDE